MALQRCFRHVDTCDGPLHSKALLEVSALSSCLFTCSRGADLNALVREAAMAALKEHMQLCPVGQQQECGGRREEGIALQESSSKAEVGSLEGCCLAIHHFERAFRKVKASISGKVVS